MKLFALLLACVLITCGCSAAEGSRTTSEDAMTLFAINVGKADCLLLRYGEYAYLIDTGEEESWGAVSAALHTLEIDHLNGVIVTHTDGDHAGGVWALACSSIQVDEWYASRYYADIKKESKHPVYRAAALRGKEVQWLSHGDVLPFGDGSLTVLGPISYNEKENCNSVVLRAEGAGGSMLLAGDMEFPEEEELLDAGVLSPCTVLKVGNHGESDATSELFAYTVRPQIAVISTNTIAEPDTPAKRVLKALMAINATIVQTQNASAGVLVTIAQGEASAEYVDYRSLPATSNTFVIATKNIEAQTIALRNEGSDAVDISGWYLYSERGKEIFVFPNGSVLPAGATVTISNLSSNVQGDYQWLEEKVWHKSKADAAVLYDVYGRQIDRVE